MESREASIRARLERKLKQQLAKASAEAQITPSTAAPPCSANINAISGEQELTLNPIINQQINDGKCLLANESSDSAIESNNENFVSSQQAADQYNMDNIVVHQISTINTAPVVECSAVPEVLEVVNSII